MPRVIASHKLQQLPDIYVTAHESPQMSGGMNVAPSPWLNRSLPIRAACPGGEHATDEQLSALPLPREPPDETRGLRVDLGCLSLQDMRPRMGGGDPGRCKGDPRAEFDSVAAWNGPRRSKQRL